MDLNIQLPESFSWLFDNYRYKVAYGGRAAAKSHSFCTSLLLYGIQENCRILCCREFMSSIKESVKYLLDDKINTHKLDFFYRSTRDTIEGINGTQFVFQGLHNNISNIKSLEKIKFCFVEEAQTISQESLDILIPTIRIKDSEIWFAFNTGIEDDPVYRMFVKNNVPNSIVKKINYYDNPYLTDTILEEIEYCKQYDIEKYNHRYLGEPLNISEASIFKGKIFIDNFETPVDSVFYHGCDFGFAESPLVILRCFIDEDNRKLFIDKGNMATGIEIEDTPNWLEQSIPGCKDWYIIADSARPEMISFLNNKGFRVFSAKKGPGSVKEGIEAIKNYKVIIHESLKDMIYEFLNYNYKVDKHTGQIIPEPEKKNDNSPDALRYALEDYNKPNAQIIT